MVATTRIREQQFGMVFLPASATARRGALPHGLSKMPAHYSIVAATSPVVSGTAWPAVSLHIRRKTAGDGATFRLDEGHMAQFASRAAPRDTVLAVTTERQKMLAGEMYDPFDPELVAARVRARDLCQLLNATRAAEEAGRRRILRDLFGTGGDTVWMQPPFYCDYGTNIELGERVFFNFNCIVLDVCQVRIGDSRCSGRRCKSTPHCIRSTPSSGAGKSLESRSTSDRMSGWAAAPSFLAASASAREPSSEPAAS
jgi:hypothetical protein